MTMTVIFILIWLTFMSLYVKNLDDQQYKRVYKMLELVLNRFKISDIIKAFKKLK
jgi:hypothetical protein